MSFESLRSLEIELETLKEVPIERRDWEYMKQVRFEIVRWALKDMFDDADITAPWEMDKRREAHNGLERAGVYFVTGRWIVMLGFEEDIMDVYANTHGERDIGRYDLDDNYVLDKARKIEIGAFVINGDVVYAEVYYDGSSSAFIRLNTRE